MKRYILNQKTQTQSQKVFNGFLSIRMTVVNDYFSSQQLRTKKRGFIFFDTLFETLNWVLLSSYFQNICFDFSKLYGDIWHPWQAVRVCFEAVLLCFTFKIFCYEKKGEAFLFWVFSIFLQYFALGQQDWSRKTSLSVLTLILVSTFCRN